MPRTLPHKRRKLSIAAQFSIAQRVLRDLHRSIDQQIECARDLEVEHAMALHKSGKAQVQDAGIVIQQARKRVA